MTPAALPQPSALRTPDRRSAAELARDTAGIVGSWVHEGYVPTPAAEAIYAQAQRGEITAEGAIAIFRERAQRLDASLSARSP